MRKFVVLILVSLGVLLLTPAVASASTPTLKSLAKSLAALQKQVKTQSAQIKSLSAQLTKAKSVLALAPYVSVTGSTLNGVVGPNIVFKGTNVHVMSTTSEADTSGLGNLIVGWDDEPATTQRSGSNNLICGDYNSFTSYGCFLAGFYNAVSGIGASVSGGVGNQASNAAASVSGGDGNQRRSPGQRQRWREQPRDRFPGQRQRWRDQPREQRMRQRQRRREQPGER